MYKGDLKKCIAAGIVAGSILSICIMTGAAEETVYASILNGDELVEGLSDDPYYSIHPESSARILSEEDVSFLTDNERQMAINEIYARHGRRFHTWQVQAYFDGKEWYEGTIEPDSFDEDVLTDTEWKNIETLQNFGEYVIEGSDRRYLSRDEVEHMSGDELQLAINEIYARHGRKFVMEEYQDYFNAQTWYEAAVEADKFSNAVFNEYESANIDLLVKLKDSQNTVSMQKTGTGIITDFGGLYEMDGNSADVTLGISVFTDIPYEELSTGDAYAYVEVTIQYNSEGVYYSSGYLMKEDNNTYRLSGSDISGATVTVHKNSIYVSDSKDAGGYYEKIKSYKS